MTTGRKTQVQGFKLDTYDERIVILENQLAKANAVKDSWRREIARLETENAELREANDDLRRELGINGIHVV